MSDSESPSRSSPYPTPPDATLDAALRDAAKCIFDAGDLNYLTLRGVRTAVEKQLNLPEAFFKDHLEWRGKSKGIVEAEAETLFAVNETGDGKPSSSPTKPSATIGGATVGADSAQTKKPAKAGVTKRGTKRSSPIAELKPKKRQKRIVVPNSHSEELPASDNGEESPRKGSPTVKQAKRERSGRDSTIQVKSQVVEEYDEEDEDDEPRRINRRSRAKMPSKSGDGKKSGKALPTVRSCEDDISNTEGEDGGPSVIPAAQDDIPKPDGDAGNTSESEMSVVIDEIPKTRRGKRPSDTTSSKKTKPSKPKASPVVPKSSGTPETEIKRLQSWLLKCGIRKVWSRELAPHSTPKSKISHLKQMLKDVGMEGRFSAEKARQIKEERELKAELEAVQDGARRWGESADEDEETSPKPRRRLARGLRELDFLGSDGEETE
ncbi:MAG: hypothetical protein M1839_000145 [Geoglossum umbratile]|nr:MAG: hypothetical protein M1839_000145 [Geoglossum umbratile]